MINLEPSRKNAVDYRAKNYALIKSIPFQIILAPTACSNDSVLLRVCRRYRSELRQALGNEVPQLCNDAPTLKLESDSALPIQKTADDLCSPVDDTEALLRSLERRLATENGSSPRMELFELLESRPGGGNLVALIKDEIGECA